MNPRTAISAWLLFIMISGGLAGQAAEPTTTADGKFTFVSSVLPREDVLDQGRTGTCWCFATTSFMETEVQRITGQRVDLSEMYTVRHAIIEKARRYVMLQGKTQFGEGGLSHDLISLARNHGLVPAAAYAGVMEPDKVHDHGELFSVLEAVLDKLIAKGRTPSPRWQHAVAGIIDAYLGTPPVEVEIEGKKMSPKEYTANVLKLPLDDYLEVMSYSYAPFHKTAELLVPDNWMHYAGYMNLPLDEFMAGIDNALAKGYSVAVDLDVSENTYRAQQGVGQLKSELEEAGAVTQEVRDAMFADRSTTDDHLLHVVGIAKDGAGKKYYYAKDSWGAGSGRYLGHRFLSENYVRAKVLAYMVHKDGLKDMR